MMDEQRQRDALRHYFEVAQTATADRRRIGLEVKSLYVGPSGHPIGYDSSQVMMARAEGEVIRALETHSQGGIVVYPRLQHAGATITGIDAAPWFAVLDNVWNKVELITPAYTISEIVRLLHHTWIMLCALHKAAEAAHAHFLPAGYDACEGANTLMLHAMEDNLLAQVDGGTVFGLLGHLASVHVNIDLVSIEEGFQFIQLFNRLCERQGWPTSDQKRIRRRYLAESWAGYEPWRYGNSPETFVEYIERLLEAQVYANRRDGHEYKMSVPTPLRHCSEVVDLDLFCRSVWWNSRLRVRGGKLVLELRAIPRGSDAELVDDVMLVLATLGLVQPAVPEPHYPASSAPDGEV